VIDLLALSPRERLRLVRGRQTQLDHVIRESAQSLYDSRAERFEARHDLCSDSRT